MLNGIVQNVQKTTERAVMPGYMEAQLETVNTAIQNTMTTDGESLR